jgi:hypothetical protein
MAYINFQPRDFFNTVLYTGNGVDDRSITGVGFQPDFLWIKERDQTRTHLLQDSTRGATKYLGSNTTSAETTNANGVQAFESDGFQLGTDSDVNLNTGTYVAWNWKADGGTTSSNSDGSITATLQSNATSGFSIATWSGTGTAGTIGHGLGVQPKLVIVKRINSPANSWAVQHGDLPSNFVTFLNRGDTGGETDSTMFNGTYPTSSVFSVGTHAGTNQSGGTYVGYIFAPITGYSAMGKYTGNGSTNGTFIYTGFKPAWVMIKRTDSADNWIIFDNKRDSFNGVGKMISANLSNAEFDDPTDNLDFVSNGFKLRTSNARDNASGGTYIYMAFAEFPLVGSNGLAGTAR